MGPALQVGQPSAACLYLQPDTPGGSMEIMPQDEYTMAHWCPRVIFSPLLWKIKNSGGDLGENLKSGEIEKVNEGNSR